MPYSVDACRFIELPQFTDRRGNLSFVQNDGVLPFTINRMYFLYDIPFGVERAGHAHRALHQLFFAFSGAFRLHLDDGHTRREVVLDQPNRAFYVCPRIWRVLNGFTSGAVCCVLASANFDENDYIRDHDAFLAFVAENDAARRN